jgi:hypothetical protein
VRVRLARFFRGLLMGFADGLLLWIPLAVLFPGYMVGAAPGLVLGGAVAGGLVDALGPRRLRTAFQGATVGCWGGYITLVVVGAATNYAANLKLLVPLLVGGFVVGAMVGALYPFGRRGATEQARDLAAAQDDLLQARSTPPPDDAHPGVTYLVSGFETRAALEGAGAGEPDGDDDYEYNEIEDARESARTWLAAQGPHAVARVMRVVEGPRQSWLRRSRRQG